MLPDRVLVADDVQADALHQYDLLLHPATTFQLTGDTGFRLAGAFDPVTVDVYGRHAIRPVVESGFRQTVPCEFIRYQTTDRSPDQQFLTAVRWPGRHGATPDGLAMTASPAGGWMMDHAGANERLMVRVGAAPESALSTDARTAVVLEQGRSIKSRHVLLLDGKVLVMGEQTILTADKPIAVALEQADSLRVNVMANETTTLTLPLPKGEHRAMYLDGAAHEAVFDDEHVSTVVPPGRHELYVTGYRRYSPRLAALRFEDLQAVRFDRDAPAFRQGVGARASSTLSSPMDALDGDLNTAWVSLPGQEMPQWVEVRLEQPERIGEVTLDTGVPCSGRVTLLEDDAVTVLTETTFQVSAKSTVATVKLNPAKARRIRVSVDLIDPTNTAARINELRWATPLTMTGLHSAK